MACSWLVFHLTQRCQRKCRHCLRQPTHQPVDLSVELMRNTLRQAREAYSCRHAALTGGEPTLHPRLADVLDALVEERFTWHIVTNGHRFDQLLALLCKRGERRAGLTAVNFSLDGADEETHDANRGAGSYREVMQAITLCQAEQIPFMLQMTLSALNCQQVEQMALVGSHLGAMRLSFSMMQPTGTDADRQLYLSPLKWRQLRDQLARLHEAIKIPLTITEGFHREEKFHVCDPWASEVLHIDAYGRLTLCCQLDQVASAKDGIESSPSEVIADLRQTSLVEAHRKLIDLAAELQQRRLRELEVGQLSEWDQFPCNYCLRIFNKICWV